MSETMDTFYHEYTDEIALSNMEDVYLDELAPTRPTWLKWVIGIALSAMVIAIFIAVPFRHLPGALLAFFNCLVVATAIIKLANKRSLCSVLAITFLIWPTLGWCVGTVYFAIFVPDTLLLNKSVKLQAVILLFMVIYLTTIFYILRKEKPYTFLPEASARRLNFLVLALFTFTAVSFMATYMLQIWVRTLAGTLFAYSFCLPLVIGAQITYMRRWEKVFAIALFSFLLVFFALANRRRFAVTPIFSFLVGLFLLSRVSAKTKLLILLIGFLGFPTYMIIGNTVREATHEIGYQDWGKKVHAMKEWKYIAAKTKWADTVFGRLFFTGGHAIITETPSRVPYLGFSPTRYLKESAIAFTPDKFFDRLDFESKAKYAGNFILNRYGIVRFYISRKHQTGVTLLGHFWLLGGFLFIIIGAVLVALVQGAVFILINRALRRKPAMALFLTACMLASAIEIPGVDFINAMRLLFWRLVLGTAFYYVFIWAFLKRPEAIPAEESTAETTYSEEIPRY